MQLFYFTQRGITHEQGTSLLIKGFCKNIFIMLPMEFALEADKLLSIKLTQLIIKLFLNLEISYFE